MYLLNLNFRSCPIKKSGIYMTDMERRGLSSKVASMTRLSHSPGESQLLYLNFILNLSLHLNCEEMLFPVSLVISASALEEVAVTRRERYQEEVMSSWISKSP